MSRTKSILLQVAFKEAAKNVGPDVNEVETLTLKYFETLIALHSSLNISLEEQTRPRGGRQGGGGGPTGTTLLGQEFNLDGDSWRDFREAKTQGKVKANFPDFKSASGKSVWMYDKQGEINDEAAALVKAADVSAVF